MVQKGARGKRDGMRRGVDEGAYLLEFWGGDLGL